MNEIPDPLQQLEGVPVSIDEALHKGLLQSTEEGWHRFSGWVQLSGENMLIDDLTLNDLTMRIEEAETKFEVELESMGVSPFTVGFNVDVNDLMKTHGVEEAHRIIRRLKALFNDIGIDT